MDYDAFDNYIATHVTLPSEGTMKKGKVTRRKRDVNGDLVAKPTQTLPKVQHYTKLSLKMIPRCNYSPQILLPKVSTAASMMTALSKFVSKKLQTTGNHRRQITHRSPKPQRVGRSVALG